MWPACCTDSLTARFESWRVGLREEDDSVQGAALAIDGITAMDRQMKVLGRDGRGSICQKAGKLVHDALAYESVI